jgi:UDP-glucose 4-epimerase
MKILVTGGLGFIGSHTVVELIESGHEVVIVDNLCNSKIEVLDKIEKITGVRPEFEQVNLLIIEDLRKVFDEHEFDGVIHFAGLKAVAESIETPIEYYENNIGGTINLLKCMKEKQVYNLVFSSTACVYGFPKENPITEDSPSHYATNPYGRTKQFIEEMLKDLYASNNNYKITILRYFNPVGAHASGLIGEDPNGIPNNLMPVMLKVARKEKDLLQIYGKDYDTEDGTCIRDFIHVVDLAKGHIKAIENVTTPGVHIYNLGTGKGTSVLELVNSFNKVNGQELVSYEYAERRPGDVPVNYANPTKAKYELQWEANLTIEDMCKDAWKFCQKNKK